MGWLAPLLGQPKSATETGGLMPMVLKASLHVSVLYARDGEGSTDVSDVLSGSFMPLWRNRLFFFSANSNFLFKWW